MEANKEKELAALASINYVKNGMVVGLGTGSTSEFMIRALGNRVSEGLVIVGVPSSERTKELATECGIPLKELAEVEKIDVTIDGADEFDPYLRLIKGGGGALLIEKIVAYNSDMNIIIADSGKKVERLGAFKLPVEVVPFAGLKILKELQEMGLSPKLRMKNGKPFITDEKNHILDIDISHKRNLSTLEITLKNIPGVVETGLFLETTDVVIMGKGNSVEIIE